MTGGAERPWSDFVLIAVVGLETRIAWKFSNLLIRQPPRTPCSCTPNMTKTNLHILDYFGLVVWNDNKNANNNNEKDTSMKDKMYQQQCNNVTLSVLLVLSLIFYIFVFDWSDLVKNGRWRLGHQLCPRQSIEGKFGTETSREERTLGGGDAW